MPACLIIGLEGLTGTSAGAARHHRRRSVYVCVGRVCVYACVREREREPRDGLSMKVLRSGETALSSSAVSTSSRSLPHAKTERNGAGMECEIRN